MNELENRLLAEIEGLQTFDPQYNVSGTSQRNRNGQALKVAQFDINVTVSTTGTAVESDHLIELFSALKYMPVILANSTLVSTPTFNTSGDLVYTKTEGGGTTTITLSCKQVALSSLIASTLSNQILIKKLRFKVDNQDVYQNEIILYKESFLGKIEKDSLSPVSYLQPNQYQTNVIDIPLNDWKIDSETSLRLYAPAQSGATRKQTLSLFVVYNKLSDVI